jgi:hypothetical protein
MEIAQPAFSRAQTPAAPGPRLAISASGERYQVELGFITSSAGKNCATSEDAGPSVAGVCAGRACNRGPREEAWAASAPGANIRLLGQRRRQHARIINGSRPPATQPQPEGSALEPVGRCQPTICAGGGHRLLRAKPSHGRQGAHVSPQYRRPNPARPQCEPDPRLPRHGQHADLRSRRRRLVPAPARTRRGGDPHDPNPDASRTAQPGGVAAPRRRTGRSPARGRRRRAASVRRGGTAAADPPRGRKRPVRSALLGPVVAQLAPVLVRILLRIMLLLLYCCKH